MGLLGGQVAIVTGAAQGIGLAIAERFVGEGATVVLADLDGDAADMAAARMGGTTHGAACDVADEAAVATLFDEVILRHGRVDVLVNNAGITRDSMLHGMSLATSARSSTCTCRGRGCAPGWRSRTCAVVTVAGRS